MDEENKELDYAPFDAELAEAGLMEGILLSVIITDGCISQFCTGGYLQDETTHLYVAEIPEDFYGNFQAYKVEDNALVLDTKKLPDVETERELMNLRMMRETECFAIVNRGKLWYDRLTEGQYMELEEWYQAWLNVTEKKRGAKSFTIPTRPKWLE